MPQDRGPCDFCGRQVTTNEIAAFPVKGWEIERGQGGANRIAGRERVPNRIAHAICVERGLKGSVNQGSLM